MTSGECPSTYVARNLFLSHRQGVDGFQPVGRMRSSTPYCPVLLVKFYWFAACPLTGMRSTPLPHYGSGAQTGTTAPREPPIFPDSPPTGEACRPLPRTKARDAGSQRADHPRRQATGRFTVSFSLSFLFFSFFVFVFSKVPGVKTLLLMTREKAHPCFLTAK